MGVIRSRLQCLFALALLLASMDVDAQRRSVRIDQGTWLAEQAFTSCPDISAQQAFVIRDGVRFVGPQTASNQPLRDFAGCQLPSPPYNGETFESVDVPDDAVIGLMGRNLDGAATAIRYNFPFAGGDMLSDGSYQWMFFDFAGGLRLVGLYGLLQGGTPQPLGSDVFIAEDGGTLWRGDVDGHQGEYFCFAGGAYIGRWNGTANDPGSACLARVLGRPRLAQIVSRDRFARPVAGGHERPALSGDARLVAFESSSSAIRNEDFNNHNDVFLFDRGIGQVQLLSRNGNGEAANDESGEPDVAPDGSHVVFASSATNLPGIGALGRRAIVLRDLSTGALEALNGGALFAGLACNDPSLGDSAHTVAFSCTQTGGVGSYQHYLGVVVRSPLPGRTFRYTLGSYPIGGPFFDAPPPTEADVSRDGTRIAFVSDKDLTTQGTAFDRSNVFRLDVASEIPVLASLASDGALGDGDSDQPSISSDGCRIAFRSAAGNLVAGDLNGATDIFVRDLCLGTTQRASLRDDGSATDADSARPSISADGRFVAFETGDSQLKVQAGMSGTVLAVRDLQQGRTRALSIALGDGESYTQFALQPALSGDGRQIALLSASDNIADHLLVMRGPIQDPPVFGDGFE
ncbi:hypothetical protein [Pseudomarimonas salicorniae]|uniref:WD40-like Beta Propeller Repeat n=1 Tax=Pseudomarimonas salicorniae TaxID=2933270 RepID=A0ABT0GFS5_9GAMM|nr:hypothetical protein [Lysobacter sp. CAU 1642]MCK7593391.1 hypothetical protein [Lysobacter sp. CAU 1642]